MKISVIIPVYNAADFVTRAVESALIQPETAEVLLIEDNSTDNSLEICQSLANKYEKIKLFRHPDDGNHGAAASRNLGMKNASCEFIGFVDADNFFLPNRFLTTRKIFDLTPDCEGVYEAIGIHVEDDIALQRWINSKRHPINQLITLVKPVEPDQLGSALISGDYGSFALDGFVFKRSILQKVGYMVDALRLHQDTEFMIRCALVAKLLPGKLDEPVAMEGVHQTNRFSAPRSQSLEYKNRMAYRLCLYSWAKQNSSPVIQKKIIESAINFTQSHRYIKGFHAKLLPDTLILWARLLRLLRYPDLLFGLLRLSVNKNNHS